MNKPVFDTDLTGQTIDSGTVLDKAVLNVPATEAAVSEGEKNVAMLLPDDAEEKRPPVPDLLHDEQDGRRSLALDLDDRLGDFASLPAHGFLLPQPEQHSFASLNSAPASIQSEPASIDGSSMQVPGNGVEVAKTVSSTTLPVESGAHVSSSVLFASTPTSQESTADRQALAASDTAMTPSSFGATVIQDTANVDNIWDYSNQSPTFPSTHFEFYGGGGNDWIHGSNSAIGGDYIAGDAGNDTIIGGGGSDTFSGGADYDRVDYGAENGGSRVVVNLTNQVYKDLYGNTLASYAAWDSWGATDSFAPDIEEYVGTIFNDYMTAENNGQGISVSFLMGDGADIGRGGGGNDTIDGGSGADYLYGNGGNDKLYASKDIASDGAIDYLYGGQGNDTLIGSAEDYLYGESGNNTLIGGRLDYTLEGAINVDLGAGIAYRATGVDTLVNIPWVKTGDQADRLVAYTWAVEFDTGGGDDTIYSGGGNDTIQGGAGWDNIYGSLGSDAIDGGADGGAVWYNATAYNLAISADLGNGVVHKQGGGVDTLLNISDLHGSQQADYILGSDYGNYLTGEDGDDVIDGAGGDDLLGGGRGNDSINGGSGDDRLMGDQGNDTLNGGVGADTMDGGEGDDIYYVDNVGDVVTELSGAAYGHDTIHTTISYDLGAKAQYVEDLTADGSNSINLTGNNLDNYLKGNDGKNVIIGGGGSDTMEGGGGDDKFYIDDLGDKAVETNGLAGGDDTIVIRVKYYDARKVDTVNIEHVLYEGGSLNYAPTTPASAAALAINENATGTVGQVASTNVGGIGELRYYLVDDYNGTFVIDQMTGVISVAPGKSFNFENDSRLVPVNGHKFVNLAVYTQQTITDTSDPDYALKVAAALKSDTASVQIEIKDVNEAPTALTYTTASVAENAAVGAPASSAPTVTDPDAADAAGPFHFDLVDSQGNVLDGSGMFDIDHTTGVIKVGQAPLPDVNDNQTNVYHVLVKVTDQGGLSYTKDIAVTVTPVPNAPPSAPVVQGTPNPMAENTTGVVATVHSTDDGNGGPLIYGLQNTYGVFQIDQNTGQISLVQGVDYENTAGAIVVNQGTSQEYKYFNLVVFSQESHGQVFSDSTTIQVRINNVNEAPDRIDIASAGRPLLVGSYGQGDVVLKATAHDLNTAYSGYAENRYKFADTDGSIDSSGLFRIDVLTGNITLVRELNSGDAGTSVKLQIVAFDASNPSLSTTTAYDLTIGADTAPTNVRWAGGGAIKTVDENSTSIGYVGADDNGAPGSLHYSIAPNDYFGIDANTGEVFATNALDYETSQSYSIKVTATDTSGLSSTETTLTINLNDVNEAVDRIDVTRLIEVIAPDTAQNGDQLIELSAHDPDQNPDNAEINYQFVGDVWDSGFFHIDQTQGIISLNRDITADDAKIYTLHIRAYDPTNPDLYKDLDYDIVIQPTSNTPPAAATWQPGDGSIAETLGAGDHVGTLTSSDPDNDPFDFFFKDPASNTLGGTSSDGAFQIDANGSITLLDPSKIQVGPDGADFTYTVAVQDSRGGVTLTDITVHVTNVNQAPDSIGFVSGDPSVAEDTAVDHLVGDLMAHDPDGDSIASYQVVDDCGGLFALRHGPDGGWRIYVNGALDYDNTTDPRLHVDANDPTVRWYEVTLRATDDQGNVSEALPVKIYVTDIANPDNSAPVITVDGTTDWQVRDIDTVAPFLHLSVSDAEDGPSQTPLTVSVLLDNPFSGTFIFPPSGGDTGVQLTDIDPNDGVFYVTGTQEDLTAWLKAFQFNPVNRPDAAGTVQNSDFQVSVIDSSGNPEAVATMHVTVEATASGNTADDAAPVITIAQGHVPTPATDWGPAVNPFADVSLTDADGDNLTVTVSFNRAEGTLGNTQGVTGETNGDTVTFSFTGSAADLTQLLQGLTFDPIEHGAAGPQVTTNFTITVNDAYHPFPVVNTDMSVVTTVIGPQQNDNVYDVNSTDDTVNYPDGEDTDPTVGGHDKAIVHIADYTLSAGYGIETIEAGSDVHGIALTGNDLANTIIGSDGNDTLAGGGTAAEADAALHDVLRGGAGDDIYAVTQDGVVIEEFSGEGTDTVKLDGATFGGSWLAYTLADNVETLDGSGSTGGVHLAGNDLANLIIGNADANVIDGGNGNDTLDGGANTDSGVGDLLNGGAGDDVYIVHSVNDIVVETDANGDDSGGVDTVRLDGAASWSSYALAQRVETLDASQTSGEVMLTGNDLDNLITGNADADTLNGGLGADTLHGGAGDDTYIVTHDGVVIEELGGEGTDTVKLDGAVFGDTWNTYTLAANVEVLDASGSTGSVHLTGNDLGNRIIGNSSNNYLEGGQGNDTLDGGAGDGTSDFMKGHGGDDIYYVHSSADIAIETESDGTDSGGIDTVRLDGVAFDATWSSYALLENVETLDGSGSTGAVMLTGNDLGNLITGNADANTLDGGAGADTLIGGDGNDTYVVGNLGDVVTEGANGGTDTVLVQMGEYHLAGDAQIEVLQVDAGYAGDVMLVGNAYSATITGGDGNDTLDSSADSTGAQLSGGLGDDTYIVHTQNDVVVEGANGGSDTVLVQTGSYQLALDAQVETLQVDAGYTDGVTLIGNAYSASITGGAGADILSGGYNGQALQHTLDGGAGNDTYYIVHAGDEVAGEVDGTGSTTAFGDADVAYIYRGLYADQAAIDAAVAYYQGQGIETVNVLDGLPTETNTAPVFTLDPTQASFSTAATGGLAHPFTGITLADADSDPITLTVSFAKADGVINNATSTGGVTASFADDDASGNRTYTFKGTSTDLQAFLANLTFNPEDRTTGGDVATQFTFTVKDDFHTATTPTDVVEVHSVINEAPAASVTGSVTFEAPAVGGTVNPFAGVNLTDTEHDTLTFTVSFAKDNGDLGGLTNLPTGVTVSDAIDGANHVYTFAGMDTDLTTFLAGVSFDPADALGGGVATDFSFSVKDATHEATNYANAVQVTSTASAGNTAPTDIELSGNWVREWARDGFTIASLNPVDPDGPSGTYSFKFVIGTDGNGDPILSDYDIDHRFFIDGDRLKVADGTKIDFEVARSHKVWIQVSDNSGVYQKQVTITVRDWLNETGTGTSASETFKGGAGDDVFDGGDGDDQLIGGFGSDDLTGGTGHDSFVFDKQPISGELDTIRDFTSGEDSIHLVADTFQLDNSLVGGNLSDDVFTVGAAATTEAQRIIYDQSTGTLFYDEDGSGNAAPMVIAVFDGQPQLNKLDFLVI